MGQKVHPIGLRLGITQTSSCEWIPDKRREYKKLLEEDIRIRCFINQCYPFIGISKILILRQNQITQIKIYAKEPERSIGPDGFFNNRKAMVKQLSAIFADQGLYYKKLRVKMERLPFPKQDAKCIAMDIAEQIQNRKPFRFVIKKAIEEATGKKKQRNYYPTQDVPNKAIKGIKIQISGRLNGVEMARVHWVRDGQVPLHTLKADIDYCAYPVQTRYGVLGLKIWICN